MHTLHSLGDAFHCRCRTRARTLFEASSSSSNLVIFAAWIALAFQFLTSATASSLQTVYLNRSSYLRSLAASAMHKSVYWCFERCMEVFEAVRSRTTCSCLCIVIIASSCSFLSFSSSCFVAALELCSASICLRCDVMVALSCQSRISWMEFEASRRRSFMSPWSLRRMLSRMSRDVSMMALLVVTVSFDSAFSFSSRCFARRRRSWSRCTAGA